MTGYQSKRAAAQDKLAQPAQEPLAWEDVLGAIARGWTHDDNKHKTMDVRLAVAIAKEIQDMVIAPPQRPWVDLTDESVTQVIDLMPNGIKGWMSDWDLYEFARAVLAKSKEKNT